MRRAFLVTLVVVFATAVSLSAQRASQRGSKPPAPRVVTAAACKGDLGVGTKSGRRFCDVVITVNPAESIVMKIPDHIGPATLMFDLHNRFRVPATETPPAQAFARHTALVGIVRPKGEIIDRAVVTSEFRSLADLFDRIAGTGPGGFKTDAPGRRVEAVRVTIPPNLSSIGIVGIRLDVLTATGSDPFDTPGRPIAIVSNLRIEYTPAR
jgi:hypothetical protein